MRYDEMKPLCTKVYLDKLLEIVLLGGCIFFDVMLITKGDDSAFMLIFIILLTAIVACLLVDVIYWIFQPRVLIYQYDTGIVINRKTKIEYTEIEKVDYKNYLKKHGKRGNYYRDTYHGVISIELKSGKVYKIHNAFYPLEAADAICQMKRQRKFR